MIFWVKGWNSMVFTVSLLLILILMILLMVRSRRKILKSREITVKKLSKYNRVNLIQDYNIIMSEMRKVLEILEENDAALNCSNGTLVEIFRESFIIHTKEDLK